MSNEELVRKALETLSYSYGIVPVCDILNVAEKKDSQLHGDSEIQVFGTFKEVGIYFEKDDDGAITFPNEEVRGLVVEIASQTIRTFLSS